MTCSIVVEYQDEESKVFLSQYNTQEHRIAYSQVVI